MKAKIFDGKFFAEKIAFKLKSEISKFETSPCLAVIVLKDDPAVLSYIKAKEKMCKKIGIVSKIYKLSENSKEKEIIKFIEKLNTDPQIHGILLQLPLPIHIKKENIMPFISSKKDVDGFNPENMGKLFLGDETLAPCTPKAVIKILEIEKINLEGKNVTIINHSTTIGKPLSIMLLNRNATVNICHIKTKNLKEHTLKADILISATGVPKIIKSDMVKEGAILIDVGITKVNGKFSGDIDFENVKEKAQLITPVPGGVGPMTVAMLMENVITCYKLLDKRQK